MLLDIILHTSLSQTFSCFSFFFFAKTRIFSPTICQLKKKRQWYNKIESEVKGLHCDKFDYRRKARTKIPQRVVEGYRSDFDLLFKFSV